LFEAILQTITLAHGQCIERSQPPNMVVRQRDQLTIRDEQRYQ
jgi:hypothetical protein